MKIWLIHHYALSADRAGGTRHHSLAHYLIQKGHSVTIYASSVDYLTRQEMKLASGENWKQETLDGVLFEWIRTPAYTGNSAARVRNLIVFAWRVWQRLSSTRNDPPDVIIGSSPQPFAALVAQLLSKRHRVPFVLEVRDIWPQSIVEVGRVSRFHPLMLLWKKLERYLYRRADCIISLLPATADYMVSQGADKLKLVWIPNGVDFRFIPPPLPPEDDGIFSVVYAGAHGTANNLNVVLDAAAILQREKCPVEFRLIGDGPEKPILKQQAQDQGLTNVHFEEPIPKQQIYQALSKADAFIMPLMALPVFNLGISPNKLFDYLASARPTIFSAASTFNPVAEANAGITVTPGNAQAMADAVEALIRMTPAERWEMGLRGRQYAETHFHFRVLADRLEQALIAVIQPERRR